MSDVLVLGGGFAGVTAARTLAEAGLTVTLLEARDRLGGRTWSTTFPGTDEIIEYGGTWISRDGHPAITAELDRYDVACSDLPDVREIVHAWPGGRRSFAGDLNAEMHRFFAPVQPALDEATGQITASLEAHGALPADLDIPADEWIDAQGLPDEVRFSLYAWFAAVGGNTPSAQSLLILLADLANEATSLADYFTAVLDVSITAGTGTVLEAIAADAAEGTQTHLGAIIRSVQHDATGVRVTTEDGALFEADAAVVALPLNCWNDIAFDPPLAAPKQEAARLGHGGQSTKVLMFAEGLAPDTIMTGWDLPMQAVLTMRHTPHGALVAGFDGLNTLEDPTDPAEAQRALAAYVDGVSVSRAVSHDWNADPFSKGAWATWRPGWPTGVGTHLGEPEGRLSFAGSDVALDGYGYIDGAVATGVSAATQVAVLLGRAAP